MLSVPRALLAAVGLLLVSACATGAGRDGQHVSSLSAVIADPLRYDGMRFRGRVYLHTLNAYEFAAGPGTADAALPREVSVLGGDRSPRALRRLGRARGVPLLVEARINVMEECFVDDPEVTCAPWPRPIFLDDIRLIDVTITR